jgi:hypothetical protein
MKLEQCFLSLVVPVALIVIVWKLRQTGRLGMI